jgi:hypothetical protein
VPQGFFGGLTRSRPVSFDHHHLDDQEGPDVFRMQLLDTRTEFEVPGREQDMITFIEQVVATILVSIA